MIQYLVAHEIKRHAPHSNIFNIHLPDWCIGQMPLETDLGRSVTFGASIHKVPTQGIADCLVRGEIDSVIIDTYGQHHTNYPPVDYCRSLFRCSSDFDNVVGFNRQKLVINIRGQEILDGDHCDYILLPPEFYEHIIEFTGLEPVFFGQLEDNIYNLSLRARFPKAEFVSGRDPIFDFETLRRSKNILPSISTFSWLAAWLSEADTIYFPAAGLFNPMQSRTHNFLPLEDTRFRFYLFPVMHAINVHKFPSIFWKTQRLLGTGFRQVSAGRLKQIIDGSPLVLRRIDSYLRFFNETFYCERYPDIGAAVAAGALQSGLSHFLLHGYTENRAAFPFDSIKYAMAYPLASQEVSNGEFFDLPHHYVEIGHLRAYLPI